jgi:hypothetical protein
MSSPDAQKLSDIQVDTNNLYQEEMFTDMQVATIRRLTPIKPDGSRDESRDVMFMGQTTVMTAAGSLPVQCPIEAVSLKEAMEKFPEAAQKAVARMIDQVRELQRQEANRIVVPKGMPPGMQGGPGGQGGQGGPGAGGGGKIQLG